MTYQLSCKIIIYIFLLWITFVNVSTSRKDNLQMKLAWRKCCKKNICIRDSCFVPSTRVSNWFNVRQRCQYLHYQWKAEGDVFSIQKPTDLQILSEMLLADPYKSVDSSKTVVWSSGSRCPKGTASDPSVIMRWTQGELFAEWLINALNDTHALDSTVVNEGCKFLAVTLASNGSISYEFQDRSMKHSVLCELRYKDVAGITSTTLDDNWNQTDETVMSEEETDYEIFSTAEFPKKIKSETIAPAEEFRSSVVEDWDLTTKPIQTTESTSPRTVSTAFCKGVKHSGIEWPDTAPGVTVNISCPEGLTGYAQWRCSAVTLKFVPDQPHIEDCKHIWISKLEEDINKGELSALKISHELAEKTDQQEMSHGDITALVDLSTKLYSLYQNQAQDEEAVLEEVILEEEKMAPFTFTGSMVASMSNILRIETKTAWEILPEIHQTRAASKILKLVTNIGSHLSCVKSPTSKSTLQFTVSKENIDLQTFILNNHEVIKSAVIFPQTSSGLEANSSIVLPMGIELEDWRSPCKQYNSAVGVIYKNVGDFLKNENITISSSMVASKVISFSLGNDTQPLYLPDGKEATIVLKHTTNSALSGFINPRCVFWNFSRQTFGGWDDSGCRLINSNGTHTICSCNHLTNFAVLMDVNDKVEEDKVLTIMTYVCCGISSLSLIATLICFITIRSLHGRRTIITSNLCICLLITNLLVLFGLDKTFNKIACGIIAGLLHFWILAAFFWMLVEGYHLYKMVILVFQRGTELSVKFYYLFAYGAPLVIVAISAGLRSNEYGRENYCWLSSNHGFIWSFAGPACIIIVINIIVFIMTLRSASTVRIKREQTTIKKIKSWTRGSMSVMCLLGLTWCLGFFYTDKTLYVFSYIFTLLNGLQGTFIFLFHILLNDKISATFLSYKKNKKDSWIKFSKSTSTNPLDKSTKRTSILSSAFTSSSTQRWNSRKMSSTVPTVSNNVQEKTTWQISDVNMRRPTLNYQKSNLANA